MSLKVAYEGFIKKYKTIAVGGMSKAYGSRIASVKSPNGNLRKTVMKWWSKYVKTLGKFKKFKVFLKNLRTGI